MAVHSAFAAERDLGADAKAIFQVKCVQCHGPQLPKPKGKFGYVLDLKRVAANPDIVVPGKPEDSQLWDLIDNDEMPAEGAKAGPLSKEEKQTVKDWITAGAPPPAPSSGETSENASAPSSERHFLDWLGRFHVPIIHFPIGLLLGAAAGELWSVWRKSRVPAPAVGFCVLLGAAGAVVAASLGWIHAANGYGSGSLVLPWHRWFGVATAAGAVILAVLSVIDVRRGSRSVWFWLMLLLESALVAATGHLGGSLVHGVDFLYW
ncbi:MAG TPA: c-type cytochrome domain-containing protein [Gemmataceae bacterium]